MRLWNFFPSATSPRFQFLDPGLLIDNELQLVPPQPRWVDALLHAAHHPLTHRDAPEDAGVTRAELEQFFSLAPLGLEPADPSRDRSPVYHFWMLLRHGLHGPSSIPPVRIAGGISLRVGSTPAIERYYGHFGYHVFPPARGQHYAERSCRLLLPLCRAHQLNPVWVTCNPDNAASRRTCERLGGMLENTVAIPPGTPLYERGERQKCRYKVQL